MTVREPRWIPASPLVAGIGFQIVAWLIVGAHAVRPAPGQILAWIHAVALGWITTTALAVLVRVLPATTGPSWRLERLARGSLAAVAGGAAFMVAGFLWRAGLVAAGAAVSWCGITAFAFAAWRTLLPAGGSRREAAITTALAATVAALAVAATLGLVMAIALARGTAIAERVALAHATIASIGWLTVLTTGVATSTLRTVLGVESRMPAAHVVVGSGLAVGLLVLLAGGTSRAGIVGFVFITCAAAVFAADAADRVIRSTTPNRAARLGVASSVVWLLAACAAAVAACRDGRFAGVAVVAALVGWVGSMMIGHLHHIGVRLIATSVIGEDDETPPWMLTAASVSLATIALYEFAAVALAASAVTSGGSVQLAASVCGLLATALLATNAITAVRRGREERARRAG